MENDLISRQAAIDRINKQREHLCPDIYPQDKIGDAAYRICAEFIGRLPSAQPERKKSKWIEFDSSEDKYDVIKCPCCKHTFTVDSYHCTDIGFVKDDFRFCPNCGADMRGTWNETN